MSANTASLFSWPGEALGGASPPLNDLHIPEDWADNVDNAGNSGTAAGYTGNNPSWTYIPASGSIACESLQCGRLAIIQAGIFGENPDEALLVPTPYRCHTCISIGRMPVVKINSKNKDMLNYIEPEITWMWKEQNNVQAYYRYDKNPQPVIRVVRDIPGLSMHRLVLCIAPDFREVPYASGLIVLQKIYDIIGRLSGIIRVSPMSVGPFANGRATDLWDLCINKLVNVAKQDHFDDRRFQLHAYEKDEFDRAKEHLSKLGTPGWCSSAAQVAAKG